MGVSIKEHETTFVRFDQISDSMYIVKGLGPRPTIADPIEDVYVLYDPETRESVGYLVENWEYAFLARHADIRQIWLDSTNGGHADLFTGICWPGKSFAHVVSAKLEEICSCRAATGVSNG